MNNIYGDAEAINRAKNAQPGDKTVYVNMDAISELPDEYEVVFTEVEFDPNKLDDTFTNVGTKKTPSWYPKTDLMYRIGEACGISGGDKSVSEPLKEEVDINPLLCKSITDEPTYRHMIVGRKVTKYSTRLMEDGTSLRSSACTSEYNVLERCMELWTKEEEETDGYGKLDANGKYVNSWGDTKQPKYRTSYQRRAHFAAELKHAHAKAETKAHCKTIRELAGLPTGFSTEDLKEGKLIFARVRRSRKVLQMETAARLQRMSQWLPAPEEDAAAQLFGTEASTQPSEPPEHDEQPAAPTEPEPEFPEAPAEPEPRSNREHMIAVLESYQSQDLVVDEFKESVENLLSWLRSNEGAEQDGTYWPKAKSVLASVESKIPEEGRIEHGLTA